MGNLINHIWQIIFSINLGVGGSGGGSDIIQDVEFHYKMRDI